MGLHFDTLIDMVENHIREEDSSNDVYDTKNRIPNIKEHLIDLVSRTTLLEFPLNAEQLLPRSGLTKKAHNQRMLDYFTFSEKLGCYFYLPFEVTAVEDDDSVVIVEHLEDIIFRVTSCRADKIDKHEIITFELGTVDFQKPVQMPMYFPVLPLYVAMIEDGIRKPGDFFDSRIRKYSAKDLMTSAVSYVEQIVYTMEPENLLFEKKKKCAQKNGWAKTDRRINYLCMSQKDAFELLGQNKEMIYIEEKGPDRYLYNQRELMTKIINDNAAVITPDNWQLTLMVKEKPGIIIPYKS